jgi:hypothetical protein
MLGKLLANLIGFEIRSDKISLNPKIIISLLILQLTILGSDSITIYSGLNRPESYLLAALVIIGLCCVLHTIIFGTKINFENGQKYAIPILGIIAIITILRIIIKLRERDSRSRSKSIDWQKTINQCSGSERGEQHNLELGAVTLIASFPFIMAMYMKNPAYGIVSHLIAASIVADSISPTISNSGSRLTDAFTQYLK